MDRWRFAKIGIQRNLHLQALRDYQKLISEVDRLCYEIRQRYGKYMDLQAQAGLNLLFFRHITTFLSSSSAF